MTQLKTISIDWSSHGILFRVLLHIDIRMNRNTARPGILCPHRIGLHFVFANRNLLTITSRARTLCTVIHNVHIFLCLKRIKILLLRIWAGSRTICLVLHATCNSKCWMSASKLAVCSEVSVDTSKSLSSFLHIKECLEFAVWRFLCYNRLDSHYAKVEADPKVILHNFSTLRNLLCYVAMTWSFWKFFFVSDEKFHN